MVRLFAWILPSLVCWGLFGAGLPAAVAADPIFIARTISALPKTQTELALAHAQNQNAAAQVGVGEPLQIVDLAGEATYTVTVDVNGAKERRPMRFRYSRLSAISYGMQLLPEDEARLPSVSKDRIMRRVRGNYVAIQLRVQQDVESGDIYLNYRPYAAVGGYGDSRTQEFAPLMESSVREFRGLGLFVNRTGELTADDFRTFVATNKDVLVVVDEETGDESFKEHYEYFFARARVEGQQVQLHCFVTNQNLQQVEFLEPYRAPVEPTDCSIASTILFTDYTVAKQSPSAKASRRLDVRTRATYPMEQLNAFVRAQGLEGDALDNLTVVLDAIIDGRIE